MSAAYLDVYRRFDAPYEKFAASFRELKKLKENKVYLEVQEFSPGGAPPKTAEFERLNRLLGQTIILVTHDPAVAERADRQITVRDGVIASDVSKTPETLVFSDN